MEALALPAAWHTARSQAFFCPIFKAGGDHEGVGKRMREDANLSYSRRKKRREMLITVCLSQD